MRVGGQYNVSAYVCALVLGLNNWIAHHRSNRFHMKCGKYTHRFWPITDSIHCWTMSKQKPTPLRLESQMFLEFQHNHGYRSKCFRPWNRLFKLVSLFCIFDAHNTHLFRIILFSFYVIGWRSKIIFSIVLGNGRERYRIFKTTHFIALCLAFMKNSVLLRKHMKFFLLYV